MKIAIINTLYAPNQVGGAEKSVQTLAENFSLLGNDVLVICLAKKNKTYQLNGVTVQAIKIKNDYWPFEADNKSTTKKLLWHIKDASNKKYNPILTKILSDFKPDILFSNNLSGFSTKVWRIAKKLNIKIVHTLRDYYLQCPKSIKFKNNVNCINLCFDCKLLSSPKKTDSILVDYLIGISDYILNDHIRNGYFKGVPDKTIYNGFDIKNTRYKRARDKEIVFGFIGQINQSKGVELLLESFSKIEKYKLLIAGQIDTEYLKHLKTVNSSNKIQFLGYIKSNLFFEKIDVLVVPSLWHEPFGRVVLESIINRKPVIASDMGGIPELLLNNRDFVFKPQEQELSKLLKKIMQNRDFLNTFNFDEDLMQNFNIQKTIDDYLNVFNEVLTEDK
tara:strand:+ start:23001 stop:24170 length:1170 start_codon:yes stop_codon:yes gene_type:complete